MRVSRTVLLSLPQRLIQIHPDCHRRQWKPNVRRPALPLAIPWNTCSRSSYSLGSNVLKRGPEQRVTSLHPWDQEFSPRRKGEWRYKMGRRGSKEWKGIWEKLFWDSKMSPAMITSKPSKSSVFLSVEWDKDSTCLRVVRIEWHNIHKAMNAMPSIMDSKCLVNVDIMPITISLLLF